MSTVAIVTSEHADEEWIFPAVDGALVLVDSAPLADVFVTDPVCLPAIADHLSDAVAIVVIGDPAAPPPRACHVVTRTWTSGQLGALLVALARRQPFPEPPLPAPSTPAEARAAQRVIAATRKLANVTDLGACEAAIVEILIELIECDRAYCLFYDHESAALWSQAKLASPAGDERQAIHGLAGFAARTGVPANAASAGADPRFVGAIDDPSGDASDRVFAQPVFGADGAVHGVMICVRRARRSPFGPAEEALLGRFARLVSPVLDHLSIDVQAQAILDEAEGNDGLFRREAIEARAAKPWGEVVRISPGWLPWAYRSLVVLLLASVVFAIVGKIATYSSGPAIVRSNARTPVTARTSGNIVAVEVGPGDHVERGAVIARLDDTDQRARVSRLERELELQLRNHMLDLGDQAADAAVRRVRNELETARSELSERLIVTPSAGTVGDIRVRPGQPVAPGDFVAAVLDDAHGLEVIALLPGEDRPQLTRGMELRLELAGYRYAYQTVAIESVASDVIAPSEARRVLGAEVADSIRIDGPVVIVRGRLPTTEFIVDGRAFRYHDGMLGVAEVRVRSEPIVYALIPGTRRFQ